MRGARHLSELQGGGGQGGSPGTGTEGNATAGAGPAHPVVVARLLQGGREEEAAAGDPRVLGTLNVPVGAGKVPGW